MSKANDGLQVVAAPAGGWCEPDTGVCHLDTGTVAEAEVVTAEADDHGAVTSETPDSSQG